MPPESKYKALFVAFLTIRLLMPTTHALGQSPVLYLIPGQGSDARVFKNLQIDPSFEIRHVVYSVPEKDMTMPEFARVLSAQIDTTHPFVLIGYSLGGMLATEMSAFLHPEKVILISSAKSRNELPRRYKFQRRVPIHRAVPGPTAKRGAMVLQPVVEPDRKLEKETCKAMLKDKDPDFLKRTIAMILEWERTESPGNIIHIHGDQDHTIPIRNVSFDYLIEGGSHMMVLTRGEEISRIINEIL